MTEEFREERKEIKVPPNTGVEGFLHTLKELLVLPRLQEIHIDARGTVKYRYFAKNGVPAPVGVNFDHITPSNIIRNGEVVELFPPLASNAAAVVAFMFERANQDQLQPVAFASGPETVFWKWHQETTGVAISRTVYGLPFSTDRHLADTHLFMCAGYGKEAALVDTQRTYKVTMDLIITSTTVDVL